ncbi:hypothetical protein ACIBEK_07450 [Nocardia fusca]|uniref:hypothetical protein n=1 Tax=Nocardia fusca TaxID=941183 RepID=UPI0037BCDDED
MVSTHKQELVSSPGVRDCDDVVDVVQRDTVNEEQRPSWDHGVHRFRSADLDVGSRRGNRFWADGASLAVMVSGLAMVGIDPNIEWIAECRGERVEWLNFLYTPPRTWVLRNRLPQDGTELTHPVAVIFLAQEKDTRWGRPHRWAIPRFGTRAVVSGAQVSLRAGIGWHVLVP